MISNYDTVAPKQGFGKMAKRPEELLLLCWYDPRGVTTVPETLAYMQQCSNFSVTVINLYEHRPDMGHLALPKYMNINAFKGIIIHNTVSYNIDNLKSLDRNLDQKLKDYQGIKVLMKMDENYRFREISQYIGNVRFDLVFTCLPDESIEKIYPSSVVGASEFERMLTGYVTSGMRKINYLNEKRPIDIGYRGSVQPLSFGRLAYEKRSIGYDIAKRLKNSGLCLDISSRWEDRYGGSEWFHFLQSCKATLGSESGASIFDLDGDLDERCSKIESRLGPFREDKEYAEAYLSALKELEDNVHYHQLSSRHFEAAATGTLQLLYPGGYSGVFDPGRHYFELKRDCSNLDEAVDLIRDDVRRSHLIQAAFEEVILNSDYWIETFVARFDSLVMNIMLKKGLLKRELLSPVNGESHVLLIAWHEPKIDPRLRWIEENAPDGIRIHQLGVSSDRESFFSELTPRGNMYMVSARTTWDSSRFNSVLLKITDSPVGMAGALELLFIDQVLNQKAANFSELLGAPPLGPRYENFRWYLQFLLDINLTLVESALKLRGIKAIIAIDILTLPAALILKGLFNVPILYDAHEYWSENDLSSFEFEAQYWTNMEKRLVAYTDYCQTVSPGLAAIMGKQYDVEFSCVPNCVPLSEGNIDLPLSPAADGICKFLFLGSFSHSRGVDLLINIWPETNDNAWLLLRGPRNAYSQILYNLAQSTGLLGTRIHFLDPVDESELVKSAVSMDVGIISYLPLGLNYLHCCPNKLSQYMAAGLPILANKTSFVAQTVESAGCGRVVDFTKKEQLLSTINELAASTELRKGLGAKSKEYFKSGFNWEYVSRPFYDALNLLIENNEIVIFRSKKSSVKNECTKSKLKEGIEKNTDIFLFDGNFLETEYITNIIRPDTTTILLKIMRTLRHVIPLRIMRTLWHVIPPPLRYRYAHLVQRLLSMR